MSRLIEFDVLGRIDAVVDEVPGASAVDVAQEVAEDIPETIVRGALAFALVAVVRGRLIQRFRSVELNGHKSIFDRRGAVSATNYKRLGDWTRHDVQCRGEYLHQLAGEAQAGDHQAEQLLAAMETLGAAKVGEIPADKLAALLDGAR